MPSALFLQSNRLTKIEGLQSLVNLRELYLSHNGIELIEGLENNVSRPRVCLGCVGSGLRAGPAAGQAAHAGPGLVLGGRAAAEVYRRGLPVVKTEGASSGWGAQETCAWRP